MQDITLGEIGVIVAFLVALISGGLYLHNAVKKYLTAQLRTELDAINNKLDCMDQSLISVDMNHTKNYLVRFLSDVEKGESIDEIERERFWEQYEHYSKIGGNSYIKVKVDSLKSKGLL